MNADGRTGQGRRTVRLAVVGDRDDGITAHRANPIALALAAGQAGIAVEADWIGTETIGDPARLDGYDGVWCVPGSPYRDDDGALRAIRHARAGRLPFLGTCGGFQAALVEYARHQLGWHDAAHAEIAPEAPRAVIAPLACALVEQSGPVQLAAGSRLARAYGMLALEVGYRCSYGLNPAFAAELTAGPLRATAFDAAGEVRAVELDGHPFFVATLFQPERAALAGFAPPPVTALLRACAAQAWVRQ